ncbi:MAG: hypothetical protein RI885_2298 [Actinomycetota bacterium]
MKQRELGPCAACGRGVMHDRSIAFYRVTFEHFVLMTGVIQRQAGLEQAMGSPVLAAVMGPDEDLAKRAGPADREIICQHCAIHGGCLAEIMEHVARRRSESEQLAGADGGGE